jgi:hypothetical protein
MERSLSEQEMFTNVLSTGDYKSAGFADARSFMDAFGMGGANLESISADKAAFAMATDNLEKESILLEAEMKVIEDMGKFFGEDSQKPEWWSKECRWYWRRHQNATWERDWRYCIIETAANNGQTWRNEFHDFWQEICYFLV